MNATTCPHCGRSFDVAAEPLTKKQTAIFRYLETFIRGHGYAPSLSEIAVEFRLATQATVHEHLNNLQRKGVLRRGPGPRNLVLLVRADELSERVAPAAHASIDESDDENDRDDEDLTP